jgi:protein-tyrosine phosphatase
MKLWLILCISIVCTAAMFTGQAVAAPLIEQSCLQPLNPQVNNSCVVSDQILWRGARPDAEAAAALVDMGVKTVVSLELILNDRKAFETAKPKTTQKKEIQYFQIRDWEPLVVLSHKAVDNHVAQFIAITRTEPKPIYVHCRSGQNRTGIMVAAYRIFAGEDIEATIKDMQQYKGIWSRADAKYLRTLTPEHRMEMEKNISAWQRKLKTNAVISCEEGKCQFSKTVE